MLVLVVLVGGEFTPPILTVMLVPLDIPEVVEKDSEISEVAMLQTPEL